MRLIEEIKPKLSSDVLQSMARVDAKKHDELAAQMAAWERKNTVTVYPMGASADFDPINRGIKRDQSIKSGSFSAASISRKRAKGESGHQNLTKRKNNTFAVIVGSINLGSFEKDEAIKVRDAYRLKNNLPAAEY